MTKITDTPAPASDSSRQYSCSAWMHRMSLPPQVHCTNTTHPTHIYPSLPPNLQLKPNIYVWTLSKAVSKGTTMTVYWTQQPTTPVQVVAFMAFTRSAINHRSTRSTRQSFTVTFIAHSYVWSLVSTTQCVQSQTYPHI